MFGCISFVKFLVLSVEHLNLQLLRGMASSIQLWAAFVILLVQPILIFTQPLVDRATVFDSASQVKQQYDYVVVGGGTAGLTVANRLTEDPLGMSPLRSDRLCS